MSESVRMITGAVNGVLIKKNSQELAVYGDPDGQEDKVAMVLFTDFRRDVLWAGRHLLNDGALAVAPAAQRPYFAEGDSLWSAFALRRFHDYSNQTTKTGITPFNVHRFVKGGDTVKWQGLDIRVLDTPGYTRGSVTYVADIDNRRFAFPGNLIYADGKIFDLYSLQDSLPGIDGYHGYAARLGELISSLQLVADQKPDLLIPCRGPVIKDPGAAIQKLIQRIHSLYRNYLSITAQRWNHTDRMVTLTNHVLGPSGVVDWMPFSAVVGGDPPSWYWHIYSSNLVMAGDSSAFLIDCGSSNVLKELVRLKKSRRLKRLDGIFITHYHDDHTDFINEAVKEFGCPVYVTKELRDILQHPAAFHMACLTTNPIPELAVVESGQEMAWKDFTLTFHYFPGQTIYHDAVLFRKSNGEAIFFIGDSFSPAGVDDYCFQNRNLLHPGTGYFYCLDVLKKLPGHVLLANQHILPLFAFSEAQLDHMREVLAERNALLKDLLPWDDVNFGTDDQWVSLYPYGQKALPGETVEYTVKVMNHSVASRKFTFRLRATERFAVKPTVADVLIAPRTEGQVTFKIRVPKRAFPGISLLLVDVETEGWDLHEWSEALIEIEK